MANGVTICNPFCPFATITDTPPTSPGDEPMPSWWSSTPWIIRAGRTACRCRPTLSQSETVLGSIVDRHGSDRVLLGPATAPVGTGRKKTWESRRSTRRDERVVRGQ